MRRTLAGLALLPLLLALAPAATASTAAAGRSGSAPAVQPLPTGTDADYQLGGSAPTAPHVGIIARDRSGRPVPGRYNICYVNGFQTQTDEKGFWKQHMNLVLHDHGKPVVDENWGEWLLDVRTPAKRAALAHIVDGWVAGCAAKGFQAVEFDNLDSFTRSHHLMTKAENVAYARLLVASAHRHGLAAGQKNLADWNGRTVGYDFAIAEQCADYDECGDYVSHYGDRVVVIEYSDRYFAKACQEYGPQLAIVRRDLDLRPSYHPRYC